MPSLSLLYSITSSARSKNNSGDFQPNRLSGRQINDEIKLARLLDRDVGRLRSAQNLVDIVGGAPVEAREVRSIGHETSRFEPCAVDVHSRQPRTQREAIDPNLIGTGEQLTNNIKGLRATLECLEGRCDIRRLPDFQRDGLDAERVGRDLHLVQLPHGRRIVDIGHDRQSAEAGDDFAQEFEALARKFGRRDRQAGDVATRPRQAGDEASAKRVRHRRENDRDDRGRLFRCEHRRSRRKNDIDLEPDKLGGDLREPLEASVCPAIFNRDGAALDPAEFTQPLHKDGDQLALSCRRARAQVPDGWRRWLLRARRERPRDCTA